MEEEKKQIDYGKILKVLWRRKWFYAEVLGITFVLSCAYIFSIPRTYYAETKVAPEAEGPAVGGSLSSLAASFGFDMADMQSTDAITPLIYPELMSDNGFVAALFKVRVKTADGAIDTDYYTYMKSKQKAAWWSVPIYWLKNLFAKKPAAGNGQQLDPYRLSSKDDEVMQGVQSSIKITVDKKLGIITLRTSAQDPLVCKTMADSARQHLQAFITAYRTNKARTDYAYYQRLAAEAKADYEKARQHYGAYSDANSEVELVSYKSKIEDLENEMQLRFNTYTAVNTQLQAAKAKIQERTPVFTLVKGASVPVKPEAPKRMMFVAFMLFLAFGATTLYVLHKEPRAA